MKKIVVFLMLAVLMALSMVLCVEQQHVVENTPPTAPTNPDPADGAKDVSIDKLYLEWDESTDPDGDIISYDVYFGESQDSMKIIDKDLGETYTYMPELEKSKTYYWKVVVKDYYGGETSSKVWSFSTEERQGLTSPEALYPLDGATDVELTPALSWIKSEDEEGSAVKYYVYFGTEQNNLKLITSNDGIEETSYELSEKLELNKIYYWEVVAKTETEVATSDIWSFATIKVIPPSAPLLKSPEYDAENQPARNPVFTWYPSTDENGETITYNLYLGTSEESLEKQNEEPITTTTYTLSKTLEYETTYYWEVEAINESGASAKSEIWSFKTSEPLLENGYLFMCNDTDRIAVYDVKSDPAHPIYITSIKTPYPTKNVYFDGRYVYTEDYTIIDLIDVENPKIVYNETEYNRSKGVIVSGNYMYVWTDTNLFVFDITNKGKPEFVKGYDKYTIQSVTIKNNYLYLGYRDGLAIADISNPKELKFSYINLGRIYSVYVEGNYAYLGGEGNKLYIYDISNPDEAEEVKTFDFDADYISAVSKKGNMIFVNIYYRLQL